MTVSQSPFLKFRGFDNNGNPLSGGLLFTYAAGTASKLSSFTDSTGVTPNTNPIILDARGECDLFLTSNLLYKFVLSPSTDTDPPTNAFWTEDNVAPIGGSISSANVNFDGVSLVTQFLSRVNRVVDSVSALRSISKLTYTRVFVSGYYAAGDGGGGIYSFNPSDVTSTDNGGNVIVASDGGRWFLSNSGSISVKQFGAKGDGATDDSASILAAVINFEDVTVPKSANSYLVSSTVTLPNRKTKLSGDGTLTSTLTLANGIFTQTNRGILTIIEGLNFTGASPGFYRNGTDVVAGTPFNGEFFEFRISKCSFVMNSNVIGIKVFGSRESIIEECYFETGQGISLDTCINVEINHCIWKTCSGNAIHEFDNTQGTRINGGTALGCSFWLLSNNCQGTILTGVISDFNDNCVVLQGAIDASIINCYLSSRTKTEAVSVTGNISGTPIQRPFNVKLIGNTLVNNYVALNPGYTGHDTFGFRAEQCNYITLQGNFIKNWTNTAVVIVGCVNTLILNNTMYQHPIALGTSSIFEILSDCVATTIHNNTVTTATPFSGVSTLDIFNNFGYASEFNGSFVANSGLTSFSFNHGLSRTPPNAGIKILPVTPPVSIWWISAINSTQATINFSPALASNFTFQFSASLKGL